MGQAPRWLLALAKVNLQPEHTASRRCTWKVQIKGTCLIYEASKWHHCLRRRCSHGSHIHTPQIVMAGGRVRSGPQRCWRVPWEIYSKDQTHLEVSEVASQERWHLAQASDGTGQYVLTVCEKGDWSHLKGTSVKEEDTPVAHFRRMSGPVWLVFLEGQCARWSRAQRPKLICGFPTYWLILPSLMVSICNLGTDA